MKLGIVAVSVRQGRVGGVVAKWIESTAHEHGGFDEVEYIDLMVLDLPMMDEPNQPNEQRYIHEHTKRWSQTVSALDAIVFVTPEYDYFTPAPLVNAIDYLYYEWQYKPVAFVGYGGASGGMRSVQSVKPLVTTVKMMPIPESVNFHFVHELVADDQLQASDAQRRSAGIMFDELARWTTALQPLRDQRREVK